MRWLSGAARCMVWVLAAGVTPASAQTAPDLDLFFLARTIRAGIVEARAAGGVPQDRLKRAYEALGQREREKARLQLLRSALEFKGIAWSEARAAASALRFTTGETVVEPRANLHSVVERAWESPEDGTKLKAQLRLLDRNNKPVFTGSLREIGDFIDTESKTPAPAEEGKYTLALTIQDSSSGEVVGEARNTVWVVSGLRDRLSALRQRAEAAAIRPADETAPVWINTVLALAGLYSDARSQPIRAAEQLASPVTQMIASGEVVERLDPLADIVWAERAIQALTSGGRPSGPGGEWIPLAIQSHEDQTLHLARVWWPARKPSGIVLLLGGTLSHDRSWSHISPAGDFICLAPSARPNSTGWDGATWEDIEDWISALSTVAGLGNKSLYVLAHGDGAQAALQQLQKSPGRLLALAIAAGAIEAKHVALIKDAPPIILMEAGRDEWVSADELRRAGLLMRRQLTKFDYLVLPETTHEGARAAGLAKAIEFISAVAAGSWKPSGAAIPLPFRRLQ